MRQRVDLHVGLVILGNAAQASQCVGAVDVHGAGSADTLAATSSEGQGRVKLVLYADQGVEHHGSGLVEVKGVGLHLGLLVRVVGVPPVDLERLQLGLVLGSGMVAGKVAIGESSKATDGRGVCESKRRPCRAAEQAG